MDKDKFPIKAYQNYISNTIQQPINRGLAPAHMIQNWPDLSGPFEVLQLQAAPQHLPVGFIQVIQVGALNMLNEQPPQKKKGTI